MPARRTGHENKGIESDGNSVKFTGMRTLNEINQKAQHVLRTSLGPVDYARYQQQFSHGSGGYTAERQPGETPKIVQQVTAMKSAGQLIPPPGAKVLTLND